MVDPLTVRAEEHVPIELALCHTLSSQIVIQCILTLQNSTICSLEESLVTAPSPRWLLNKRGRGCSVQEYVRIPTIDRTIILLRCLGIDHTAVVLLYRVR